MRPFFSRALQLDTKSLSLQRYMSKSAALCSNQKKVYELRQYQIRPEKLGEFNQLFTKYSHLGTSQSKLVGYWFTELGSALAKAVHIWEYDDLEHRAQVRKTLASEKEWMEKFISKAIHFWSPQENCTMTLPDWIDQVPAIDKKNGIYEMMTISFANSRPIHNDSTFQKYVEAQSGCDCDLIGVWYNDSG